MVLWFIQRLQAVFSHREKSIQRRGCLGWIYKFDKEQSNVRKEGRKH